MKWLNKTVLETENVKLIPLEELHADSLIEAAADGELWNL